MKKMFMIKNPELFQGEKYLHKNKDYFEGWYFKNTSDKTGISFIPGININENDKKAFIQIITTDSSYFINYNIDDFTFNITPFYIKIKNNFFSKDKIHIDIKDDEQNLTINGDLKYSNNTNINKTFLSPNIMGPFSYVPFMECNHAILSMKSRVDGVLNINNKEIVFDKGIGYIEKDWGVSFPKHYIWCQGNNYQKEKVSFMLSIASVPLKCFNFRGVICVLIIDEKEYKFTTYNNARVIKYEINNDSLDIVLKKGKYSLYIKSNDVKGLKLLAPIKGKMEKEILESINSLINVTLKKEGTTIFSDSSINCGLEIVRK